ncbi:MAG: flavodoxin family protein [Syntrophales bacterium]|jgi:multimeric flavodoxin WrbA|nr:flavodoxin family protein [Syntrophales bacterium]
MIIKLLGICGSPVKNGNTQALLEEGLRSVQQTGQVETDSVSLAGMRVEACKHCNWCVRNQAEDKFCAIEDEMESLYAKMISADGIVIATPVHAGRLSGIMANALDRMRVFKYGRVYGGKLAFKVGGGMAVGFVRDGGLEMTLLSLAAFFETFEMIIAGKGATGLTSLNGTGRLKKGVRKMVLEDEYGLRSARKLCARVVDLSRRLKGCQIEN